MEQGSLAPVVGSIYSDPALVAKYPYLPTLLTAITNAVPRPVTPFYPAVSKAIVDNSYAAMKGDKTAAQAIKDMGAAITAASAG
jgi:multiple sugar transport system substrate-binding protein